MGEFEIISISDIQPDDNNANKGSERGTYMLRRSLEKLGAGRSILLDKNGKRETGAASMRPFIEAGFKPLAGYQLRYIYFIDPAYRARLTVPELPYSEIERAGAGMYKGVSRAGSVDSGTSDNQSERGGAIPTPALYSDSDSD